MQVAVVVAWKPILEGAPLVVLVEAEEAEQTMGRATLIQPLEQLTLVAVAVVHGITLVALKVVMVGQEWLSLHHPLRHLQQQVRLQSQC
jgi:hypothetical protein